VCVLLVKLVPAIARFYIVCLTAFASSVLPALSFFTAHYLHVLLFAFGACDGVLDVCTAGYTLCVIIKTDSTYMSLTTHIASLSK
jgi:hypothetical protein